MSDTSNSDSHSDPKRELLRHALATLAYRAGKAVRDAPAGFADFHAGEGVRTAGQILAHMGDLFDWALSIAKGQQSWRDSKALSWDKEVERFFAALKAFDDFLESNATVEAPLEKLLQGPTADALTHVGQLAILRRLARAPVKGARSVLPGPRELQHPRPLVGFHLHEARERGRTVKYRRGPQLGEPHLHSRIRENRVRRVTEDVDNFMGRVLRGC